MNYVIAQVKTQRKKYTNMNLETGDTQEIADVNGRMLTVEKYHDLARRIIGKWAPPYAKTSMLNSEDAIDYVAHKIMMGDWGYDKDKSGLKTFRGYCGKRAIQDYLGTLAGQHSFITNCLDSTSYTKEWDGYSFIQDKKVIAPDEAFLTEEQREENRNRLKTIMSKLNATQQSCLAMYYMGDMNMTDIAHELDMTREGVRKSIDEALKYIKEIGHD